jgi:sulfur dioxygenase
MNQTQLKPIRSTIQDSLQLPADWDGVLVQNDDNLTYFLFNSRTKEGVIIDPMKDDWNALEKLTKEYEQIRIVAVIDTHTHADHISCAGDLAVKVHAPLIMHSKAPSRKIQLKVSADGALSTLAGPLSLIETPGHTHDSICVHWGPFFAAGDTFLYGDCGRNDLPTGDPEAHYLSIKKLEKRLSANETLLLPGHDQQGRTSSWGTQLKANPMLKMDQETFVREAAAYIGPSPKLLKESLFENFK